MNRLFPILLAGAALFQVAASQDCLSLVDHKTRCMTKAEVGPYSVYMTDGDPCFSFSGGKYCFVSLGSLHPCDCGKSECGCGEAQPTTPAPTCDNSEVPGSFDCDSGSEGYCDTNEYGADHTMCNYCGTDNDKCVNICQYGLSEGEKEDVLNKHNELRRRVAKGQETLGVNGGQPKAANMFKLSWDDELATIAQRWADQCQMGHDDNRNTTTFSYVGQNAAAKYSSALSLTNNDVTGMVQMWYDEVKDFPGANVGSYSQSGATGVVGHYTQVAWGSTTKVGCGFIQHYPVEIQGTSYYGRMMICNYGKGGNVLSTEMYKVGEAGSACPNGQDDGLCL